MTTNFFKAAAIAAVLGIAAIGSASAGPVRPATHASGTTATEVQYYGGGYPHNHSYRPPPRHYHNHYNHHRYQPPHYRHHGGYHRY